jgi:hypothetical protein
MMLSLTERGHRSGCTLKWKFPAHRGVVCRDLRPSRKVWGQRGHEYFIGAFQKPNTPRVATIGSSRQQRAQ